MEELAFRRTDKPPGTPLTSQPTCPHYPVRQAIWKVPRPLESSPARVSSWHVSASPVLWSRTPELAQRAQSCRGLWPYQPARTRLSHRLSQNLNKECTWPGPECCPAVLREKDVEAGSGWWCRWAESPVEKPREDRATGLQQPAHVPGVPSPPLWACSSDSVKTASCLPPGP